MKHLWTVVLAVVCGFLGGIAAAKLASRHSGMNAPTTVQNFSVLRANRFELLNESGQPIAHWGFDRASNTNEIAFTNGRGKAQVRLGAETDDRPFLIFGGQDGADRFFIRLDKSGKPILVMNDEGWEGRVMLGHINSSDTLSPSPEFDSWSLRFSDPATDQSAGIGVSTPPREIRRTGFVFLRDANGATWAQRPQKH